MTIRLGRDDGSQLVISQLAVSFPGVTLLPDPITEVLEIYRISRLFDAPSPSLELVETPCSSPVSTDGEIMGNVKLRSAQ